MCERKVPQGHLIGFQGERQRERKRSAFLCNIINFASQQSETTNTLSFVSISKSSSQLWNRVSHTPTAAASSTRNYISWQIYFPHYRPTSFCSLLKLIHNWLSFTTDASQAPSLFTIITHRDPRHPVPVPALPSTSSLRSIPSSPHMNLPEFHCLLLYIFTSTNLVSTTTRNGIQHHHHQLQQKPINSNSSSSVGTPFLEP